MFQTAISAEKPIFSYGKYYNPIYNIAIDIYEITAMSCQDMARAELAARIEPKRSIKGGPFSVYIEMRISWDC